VVKAFVLAAGAALPLLGCQLIANVDDPLPFADGAGEEAPEIGVPLSDGPLPSDVKSRDQDAATLEADAPHDVAVEGDGAGRETAAESGVDSARDSAIDVESGPSGMDSAPDTTMHDSGSVEAGPDVTVDSAPDTSPADAEAEPDVTVPCPGQGGPTMVNVGTFCIDSTEVTNAQYTAFLAAGPGPNLQPAECSFNTDYTPSANWPYPSGQDDYPVTMVNWCDGYAFCAWAGKRLCGNINGGPLDPSSYGDVTADERYYACSNAGMQPLPYGGTYTAGACNLDQPTPVAVASLAGCEGGFAGVFDLVGNVEEWLDSCSDSTGASDSCMDGTGSFGFPGPSGESMVTCGFSDRDMRGTTDPNVGFRCCAP
jgi:formylglycine-generating enzyme required for sulfatase activity